MDRRISIIQTKSLVTRSCLPLAIPRRQKVKGPPPPMHLLPPYFVHPLIGPGFFSTWCPLEIKTILRLSGLSALCLPRCSKTIGCVFLSRCRGLPAPDICGKVAPCSDPPFFFFKRRRLFLSPRTSKISHTRFSPPFLETFLPFTRHFSSGSVPPLG